MAVYPYVYYKKEELDQLSSQLGNSLATWANQWLASSSDIQLESVIPFDVNDCVYGKQSILIHIVLSEGKWVDCWLKEDDIHEFTTKLFGVEKPFGKDNSQYNNIGIISKTLALKAIQSMITEIYKISGNSLEQALSMEILDQHPVVFNNTAIGKLKATISLGNIEVDLMMSPLLSYDLVGRKYITDNQIMYNGDIKNLFRKGKVPYEISLGTVDILLKDLASLQAGDVIKMDKKLDESCQVQFSDSEIKYNCTLGRVNGSKAVRLDS